MLDEVRRAARRRVVLALDLDLQRAAEQALRRGRAAERSAAEGRRRRARRAQRRRARAWCRGRPSTRTTSPGGIDTATWKALHQRPLRAAAEPRDPEPVPARLDLQGLRRRGRAPRRRASTSTRRCSARARSGTATAPTAAGSTAGTAPSNVHRALRSSCDVFFYTAGVEARHRPAGGVRPALRARRAERDRPRARGGGREPEHRVEAEALRRALVPGRDGLGLDRPGLRPDDAAPARRRLRRARERRKAPEAARSRCASSRATARRSRSSRPTCARDAQIEPVARRGRAARPRGRRRASPAAPAERARGHRRARRRQDRHVAGGEPRAHQGARRGETSRQVPRPRLVRRVRAGRGARDRRRRASSSTACTARPPRRRSRSACSQRYFEKTGRTPPGRLRSKRRPPCPLRPPPHPLPHRPTPPPLRAAIGGRPCRGLTGARSSTSTGRSSGSCC